MPFLLAVMGQTGSGKSAIAEQLSERTGARLINSDAFQVYRGLDIGTAKPSEKHRYDLLDVVDPTEDFGAGDWIQRVVPILEQTFEIGQSAILVGGSGYYVRALMEEYRAMKAAPDPELRKDICEKEREHGLGHLVDWLNRIDPNCKIDFQNPVRVRRALERALTSSSELEFRIPSYLKLKISTNPNMNELESAWDARVQSMLDLGWEDEVRDLLQKGVPETSPGFRAIGYQSVSRYLNGELDRNQMVTDIVTKTRQFAKRQRTWLRTEPSVLLMPQSRLNHDGFLESVEYAFGAIKSLGEK